MGGCEKEGDEQIFVDLPERCDIFKLPDIYTGLSTLHRAAYFRLIRKRSLGKFAVREINLCKEEPVITTYDTHHIVREYNVSSQENQGSQIQLLES